MWSILPIAVGLIVEWPAVYWLQRKTWLSAAWLTLLANLASALVGSLVIAFGGMPLGFGLSLVGMGDSPFEWALIALLAIAANTIIEAAVLIAFRVTRTPRLFAILAAANTLSVGLAIYAEWKGPPLSF